MSPKRIGRHVGGGAEPDDEREARERRDRLREAFSLWTTGVTILAVRDAGRVHALTASGFLPVSIEPPLVLVSLGPNASARPYISVGTAFAISILGAGQKGLASRYADTFPVGPSPFAPDGAPTVDGALARLVCRAEERLERGDHLLVVGRVEDVATVEEGDDRRALAYFQRDYHPIG